MAKQTQKRITISPEFLELKGWNENSILVIVPYSEKPNDELTKDTPLIIKEVPKRKR